MTPFPNDFESDSLKSSICLFQTDPIPFTPSLYPNKTWKSTIKGYLYEANNLTRCVMRNLKYMEGSYQWAATIKFRKYISPETIRPLWQNACNKLAKEKIVGLWVIEVCPKNTLHYHMLLSEPCCPEDPDDQKRAERKIKQLFVDSLPSRKDFPFHCQVKPIKHVVSWVRYMCKAKTRGLVGQHVVPDKYKKKRLLFRNDVKLAKHGTISGRFWAVSRKKLHDEITKENRSIREALRDPDLRNLADHMISILDGVDPTRIERLCGLRSDRPAIRAWLEQVKSGNGFMPGKCDPVMNPVNSQDILGV